MRSLSVRGKIDRVTRFAGRYLIAESLAAG